MDITEEKKIFNDALNHYYKVKDLYESNWNEIKLEIINNTKISWKEKRRLFQKQKPKCINCKRPVGSLFYTKYGENKTDDRHLIALCGDRGSPCSLNIDINLGETKNILEMMNNEQKQINELKKQIIKDKNNLLYNYISSEEAVDYFDKIKQELNDSLFNYEFAMEQFMNIMNNPVKNETIDKLQIDVEVFISNIKKIIKEFDGTKNNQFIIDAVHIYVDELKPTIDKLVKIKFPINIVEFDASDKIYRLIQKPFSIEEVEVNLSTEGQNIVNITADADEKKNKKKNKNQTQPKISKANKKNPVPIQSVTMSDIWSDVPISSSESKPDSKSVWSESKPESDWTVSESDVPISDVPISDVPISDVPISEL